MNIYDLSKLKDAILAKNITKYSILDHYNKTYTKEGISLNDETYQMVKIVEDNYEKVLKYAFEDILPIDSTIEAFSIGIQFKPIISLEGIKLLKGKNVSDKEKVMQECIEKGYILKDYVGIDNINGVVIAEREDYTIEPSKKVAIVNFNNFKNAIKELGYNIKSLEFEEDEISFDSVVYGIVDEFYSLAASDIRLDKNYNFIMNNKKHTK